MMSKSKGKTIQRALRDEIRGLSESLASESGPETRASIKERIIRLKAILDDELRRELLPVAARNGANE